MLISKNKGKMGKKALCLIFAFLLSINSFAAIVSDNDGSAFVTKAEFEALKKNFADQIDNYNDSIDSKIDGAIADYLSGMDLAKDPTNFFTTLKSSIGEVRFLNDVKPTSSTITTNEILNVYRQYYQKRYTGMVYIFKFYPAVLSNGRIQYTMNTALIKSGTASSYTDQNSSTYLLKAATSDWGSGAPNSAWINGPSGDFATNGTQSGLSTKNVYGTNDKQVSVSGEGQVYIYKTTPIGRKVLLRYNSSYYPVCIVNAYAHSYINYAANFWTNYKGTNLQRDTTSLSLTVPSSELLIYGKRGTGTPYNDSESSSTAATRWAAQVYTIGIDDGFTYETAIWGLVPSSAIYCVNQNATLVAGSTKTQAASDTQTTISAEKYDSVHGMEEVDVTMSGVAVTYTPPKLNTESHKIDYFCNDYVSTLIGETVYHGQGIKIAEMPQDGDLNVTLKFKNAGNENASLKFILTDGKVGASTTQVLNNWEDVSCNRTVTIERKVSFDKKGDLWINCYSNTSGVDLILEDVSLKLD